MLQENKIKSLYEDGLVNFNSFFEKDLLQELVVAKENLFNEYPYGQDDKLNKKTKSDFVRPGSYMIWDVIEKKPVFAKILENKFIKEIATRVLGANYTVGSFYIRKTPKINEKLNPHIDYQGGLSFSILLDDINLNQGETFFYKESHKLPPPSFIDFKKFKKIPHSITGKVGDTFFWFPDCWHGRNINSNEKETTILMCHLGNACYPNSDATGRKVNYSIKKKDQNSLKRNKVLDYIFEFCGRSSNNFFTHLIYCLIYFKLDKISKDAIDQKTIFTRNKYGNKEVDNFSVKNYLSSTDFLKVISITFKTIIKKILGKKVISLIKKTQN